MERISGSGAYCVLRQECQEIIFCMSALNCAKMRSLSYQVSAYRGRVVSDYRAGQNLPKQRGSQTVICPNRRDGTYFGIWSLLCAQIGVPGNYFLHERIELCKNALAIVPNICLQSGVLSAYRARQNLPKQRGSQTVICPNSGDGTYYGIRSLLCAQIGVPGTYFLHERIELCENALAIVPNICLQSGVVSAYRAGQNLHKQRGSQTVICPNSRDRTYFGIRSLQCAQIGVTGTYFLHKRIELCENALAIVPNILPIEWGRICINSEVARLLSAQIAEMEPITGSGAYCVLRQECQEPIFCISALNCAKMHSLSYQIYCLQSGVVSAYRAGQNLPKQRGSQTVICPNRRDGTYFGIWSLLCAQIGVPGNYFLHERIELCENALAIVPNICLQSGVVHAYRAGQNLHKQRGSQTDICPTVICPNSSDGTYYLIQSILCAQIGVPGTYFLHERIELCENALGIVPNICLQSGVVFAYRAGQNLPKQ